MGPYRFVGYAIVSADGMLAAADGLMPASLKFAADQAFFEAGLNDSDLVVHGRNSWETHPQSPKRRRLFVTRRVTTPARDPSNPNAFLWNPACASFEEAALAAGVRGGKVTPIGGTEIFDMFLDRYDAFCLSGAPHVRLPGGIPVFHGVPARSPQQILAAHGLHRNGVQLLDRSQDVTVETWTRA